MVQQAGGGKVAVRLLVGLGNPGPDYAGTRHNVGARFVEAAAQDSNCTLRQEMRFHGRVARLQRLFLLLPSTWMNESGRAVAALARYHKLVPEEILVVHDELDLPSGIARLKKGGGHGGHRGLRDIAAALNSSNFYRLRLGIGHPGSGERACVTRYVLGTASKRERTLHETALTRALTVLPVALAGDWETAMQSLHTAQAAG